MTSDRHLDPVAFQPRGWLIAGGTETAIGLVAIAIVLTATLTHPGENAAHSALLYLSGLLVVAGFITIAATLAALVNARWHLATSKQISQVALQVGHNGYLANQLLAARTVDLVEMQDRMEGVARDLTVNAIADLQKSSDSRYHALSDHVAELGAKVDQMIGRTPAQGGGKVLPMPNTRIYELGIAEGERRARGGRDN